MARRSLVVAAALASLLSARPASAHDVDVTSVARVFLDQIGDARYVLSVVDAKVPPISNPEGVLPSGCRPLDAGEADVRVATGFVFECDTALDADDALVLPWSLAGVVVVAHWADGTGGSAYFKGGAGSVAVDLGNVRAGPGSRWRLAGTYLALGAGHILGGVDHLLFVLGLLLLVRGLGALVRTVTAFTLAHSMTLAASVLGYIPIHRAPIEAAIALSIVLLAREIVAADRGLVHLTHKKPWLVAFIFGLLHGLGFAGALGDIGLPASAIPLALLFFNLGVEVGQLSFVFTLLIIHRLVRGGLEARLPKLQPFLGYSLGALATLWFFQRLPAIWGG